MAVDTTCGHREAFKGFSYNYSLNSNSFLGLKFIF